MTKIYVARSSIKKRSLKTREPSINLDSKVIEIMKELNEKHIQFYEALKTKLLAEIDYYVSEGRKTVNMSGVSPAFDALRLEYEHDRIETLKIEEAASRRLICPGCDEPFIRNKRHRKYCSFKCRNKTNRESHRDQNVSLKISSRMKHDKEERVKIETLSADEFLAEYGDVE